jgi:hypothetical protein
MQMGVRMADTQRGKKMAGLTVAALLGLFVGAAVLAVVSHLLPGRLSGLVKTATDKARRQ